MKLLSRLSAAALALGLFTVSTLAQAEYVSIARDGSSLRSGPSTKHAIEWTLAKGYPLKVQSRQGKWLKVKDFESDAGWVHQSVTSKARSHIVNVPTANMRQKPTAGSKLIGKVNYGDVLQGVDQTKGWVKVKTDAGLTGWVSEKLVWGW